MHPVVRRLFNLSIFYKVLVANSAIVLFGAVVGTWWTADRLRSSPSVSYESLLLVFVGGGLMLSIAVNYLALKVALSPLSALERTVVAVRNGDFNARAIPVLLGDPQVEQLRDALNSVLDAVQRYRHEVQLLSSQAINAQEEERKRVARELHDQTAQALTSLLVRLRVLERAPTLDAVRAQLGEFRAVITQTLDDVRNLALELRPSALDDLGLSAALDWYVREWSARFQVPAEFEFSESNARFPGDVEVVLYRVVQEALTNVAKHAGARQVRVSLEVGSGQVVAEVVDDGRGFDVDEVMRTRERGLGLFGMQERLALVGGALAIQSPIQSAPGRGTRLAATVPVDGKRLATSPLVAGVPT
ncbi:MAG: sensor histidine kinase [Chloroflexi bacterium]|nr:sensor histidine kinase [Chloroflexota bacterium]